MGCTRRLANKSSVMILAMLICLLGWSGETALAKVVLGPLVIPETELSYEAFIIDRKSGEKTPIYRRRMTVHLNGEILHISDSGTSKSLGFSTTQKQSLRIKGGLTINVFKGSIATKNEQLEFGFNKADSTFSMAPVGQLKKSRKMQWPSDTFTEASLLVLVPHLPRKKGVIYRFSRYSRLGEVGPRAPMNAKYCTIRFTGVEQIAVGGSKNTVDCFRLDFGQLGYGSKKSFFFYVGKNKQVCLVKSTHTNPLEVVLVSAKVKKK